MSTRMFEVQQKFYTALEKDMSLKKLVKGIYDYVPEKTRTPYVTFGPTHSSSADNKTGNGETITASIDIWSESKGRKQVIDIMKAVEEIFKTEVSLDTATVIWQKITNRDVDEINYGLYQGTVEIEVLIEWDE